MNFSWFSREPEPAVPPAPRLDFHAMRLEREMGHFVRDEFAPKPRDLDQDKAADLFADGLEIAQRILDWEEAAGQSITPLIDHIKAAQQLRKNVTEKAAQETAS